VARRPTRLRGALSLQCCFVLHTCVMAACAGQRRCSDAARTRLAAGPAGGCAGDCVRAFCLHCLLLLCQARALANHANATQPPVVGVCRRRPVRGYRRALCNSLFVIAAHVSYVVLLVGLGLSRCAVRSPDGRYGGTGESFVIACLSLLRMYVMLLCLQA